MARRRSETAVFDCAAVVFAAMAGVADLMSLTFAPWRSATSVLGGSGRPSTLTTPVIRPAESKSVTYIRSPEVCDLRSFRQALVVCADDAGHGPAESRSGKQAAGPRTGVRKFVTLGRRPPQSDLTKYIRNSWGGRTWDSCERRRLSPGNDRRLSVF